MACGRPKGTQTHTPTPFGIGLEPGVPCTYVRAQVMSHPSTFGRPESSVHIGKGLTSASSMASLMNWDADGDGNSARALPSCVCGSVRLCACASVRAFRARPCVLTIRLGPRLPPRLGAGSPAGACIVAVDMEEFARGVGSLGYKMAAKEKSAFKGKAERGFI